MNPSFLLLSLSLMLPAGVARANALYRCTDPTGVVLYTNQKATNKHCTVLSVQVPRPAEGGKPLANAGNANGAVPPTSTPSPAGFPRVSSNEQRSRDTDRRAILETELATERANLENARKTATANAVALHERNIAALNKEISKLK